MIFMDIKDEKEYNKKKKQLISNQIDEIVKIGKERMSIASDTMKGLLPSEVNRLDVVELKKLNDLQLQYIELESKFAENPKERVKIKRQLRRNNIQFDNELSIEELQNLLKMNGGENNEKAEV